MLKDLNHIPYYFLQPVRFLRTYNRQDLQPDLIAGITNGVLSLPVAIAFALIAELPPEMGLYASVVAAIVGGLWGSSRQMTTGPANAISILVLSILLSIATPGTYEFIIAAGMAAVMAGLFQLIIGLARLGLLVNFVSHSVVVGFAGGAGVLIAVNQLRHLFDLQFPSDNVIETIQGVFTHLPDTHWPTMTLGVGTMVLIILMRKINHKLPGALIAMIIASGLVFFLELDKAGVNVVGELPRKLPPLAQLPLSNLNLIAKLATGSLAIAAIGLVQTSAIARSIALKTGQRLDNNQEFVGQGLANIAAGFFTGYPVAGSFSRSAINVESGARTPLSVVVSGLVVLIAMLLLAPLAAYLPRPALAGVLILTALSLTDQVEIKRIWQGNRSDAIIMLVTFFGTIFLRIEFAVLLGILLSFAFYIIDTSVPRVYTVLPDDEFKHILPQPHKASCPQLGLIEILGDLYFGAVNHVEEVIRQNLAQNPEQRFLLLRMHSVNNCDISGIQMLESIMRLYRERGGDLFVTQVREPVYQVMQSTGFYNKLGADHFLSQDGAISYLFHKVLDPAICIYECDVRAFKECQNLPKRSFALDGMPAYTEILSDSMPDILPADLWQKLRNSQNVLVIDVREPREFKQGHIPQAQLIPLPEILSNASNLPHDREIVLVCQGGRRSTRAAHVLHKKGRRNVTVLRGGMLAWEAAGLLEAVEL